MIPNILAGIVTGGFSFLSDWWDGKKEQAKQELSIKQETARINNEIRLKQVVGQLDIDASRVEQMSKSWKDEVSMFIFYIPLFTMFLSPFVDLIMLGEYSRGMLALAAESALTNLDNAPSWYTFVVVVITMLNFGYEKGIDKFFQLISRIKGN